MAMSRKNSIDSTAMVGGMYVERHKHENTHVGEKKRGLTPLFVTEKGTTVPNYNCTAIIPKPAMGGG
eukprot:scaffold5613_cov210-Skeletonema_marinoi.AAC.2